MSLGSSLREVRREAGLSVSQLANQTRIPASVIEDLENDRFNTSGGPSYARGHVRTIAKICGVNPEPLLSQFESQTIPLSKSIRELLKENSVITAPQKSSLTWKQLGGIFVVIGLLVVAGIAGFTRNSSNSSSAKGSGATASPSASSATVLTGANIVLSATSGNSWVSVSDSSGATQFSGQLSTGQKRAFRDSDYLDLVIGNAGVVDVEVNGKSSGRLGGNGQVIRARVTSEGITNTR
jgi:cytoskeletal protein RodZ